MKGGGCMLPILESIMPLMNDLWGCELLGTDFTACAFRATPPSRPKLCSTRSRNPKAFEQRESWRSSPYFPKTSPRTKRMRRMPQAPSPMDCGMITRSLHSRSAQHFGRCNWQRLFNLHRGLLHAALSGKQPPANLLRGIHCCLGLHPHTTSRRITRNHNQCFVHPDISPGVPFRPSAHDQPPAPR